MTYLVQETASRTNLTVRRNRSAIKSLKCEKSPGLDNMPSELLKNGMHEEQRLFLFYALEYGKLWPNGWKLQEFVILYKSGDPKNCSNYKTIALISHVSKILLIVILNRLKNK